MRKFRDEPKGGPTGLKQDTVLEVVLFFPPSEWILQYEDDWVGERCCHNREGNKADVIIGYQRYDPGFLSRGFKGFKMKYTNLPAFTLLIILAYLLFPIPALADYLGGITFDRPTLSYLPHGEYVTMTVDYKVDHPDGGRIFARPYTNGLPTLGAVVNSGPIVSAGNGTTTHSFKIVTGDHIVTHVRFWITAALNPADVWIELYVPVRYVCGPHGIFNLQMNHGQYSRLPWEEQLTIDFDYEADWPGNIRISARPFTDGQLTPDYSASGSTSRPPSGSYSQHFTFSADADVTDIRFQIYNDDWSVLIFEIFIPYEIYWREIGIYDFSFNWPEGESLHNSQFLAASFTVEHYLPEDPNANAICTTGGSLTPGYAYPGSAPVPAGPQAITRVSRVYTGEQYVDGVMFSVGFPGEMGLLIFIVPVDYHYGPHAVQNLEFSPAEPAILSNGEPLDMTFDYVTDNAAGVRIYGRAAFNEEPLFGMSNAGSPLYPAPEGSGDFWLTYNNGQHLANSIRFQVWNPSNDDLLLEHFAKGWWAWGTSGTITPVPESVSGALLVLGSCYPNPFNPTTTIPFYLGRDAHVRLTVYDLRGRLVQTLQNGNMHVGEHAFTFSGDGLASGAYIYRLETPAAVQTRRMTLIK